MWCRSGDDGDAVLGADFLLFSSQVDAAGLASRPARERDARRAYCRDDVIRGATEEGVVAHEALLHELHVAPDGVPGGGGIGVNVSDVEKQRGGQRVRGRAGPESRSPLGAVRRVELAPRHQVSAP